MFASPDVLADAVRTNLFPSKLPVHRAKINREGRDTPPPGFRIKCGVRETNVPLSGTPAMVPEYGCGGVWFAPLNPPTLCHVIVAVPEPVGNPVVAHPDNASVTNAMPIPPDHGTTDDLVFRAGPKSLRSWLSDI